MCGRFVLAGPGDALAMLFALAPVPGTRPRYNIAPGQPVLAVRAGRDRREAWEPRWGLVPSHATDASGGARAINARAETVATRPTFRAAFASQRCLVPADGFYEWQRGAPWLFRLAGDAPFAFAGLWDRWIGPEGTALETVAIVTTPANRIVAPIHDRMPAILDPADHEQWLDPTTADTERLRSLLQPFPGGRMTARSVSRLVNDVAHDGPECLGDAEQGLLF